MLTEKRKSLIMSVVTSYLRLITVLKIFSKLIQSSCKCFSYLGGGGGAGGGLTGQQTL